MKAAELLRLYEAGRRDFRGQNLRCQNFKGKNLSGADFSGSNIQSANFTDSNLADANLTLTRAGLHYRWIIVLVFISLILSAVSGFFSAVAGIFVGLIFDSNSFERQVIGWTILVVIVIVQLLLIYKRAEALAIALAVAVSVALSGTLAGILAGVLTGAPAGALTLVGVLAGALAGALALSGALAVAVAGAVAGRAAVIGAVVVATATAGVLAAIGTLAILGPEVTDNSVAILLIGATAEAVALLSINLGWRALKGDERDIWICSMAVAFSTIGGTSFRGATLTNADFSQARLTSTDFRRAVLLRTCWRDAINLDRVRPGETYLKNPKIRELVLTGNGQGQFYDNLLNLTGINLQGANLVKADFTGSNLTDGVLQEANLANATFNGANLNGANLQDADLSNAKLAQTQLDEADLTGSTLTGACIEDWNITTRTKLYGIRCDYLFMRLLSDRRPDQNRHRKPDDWNKIFADGEFVDFIAPMVETLDLYHNQSVDPRAVAIAFSDLRQQNPNADLEIISMEKRGQNLDKFNLRVRTSPQADLSQLHHQYFDRYEHLLTLPPQALVALLVEKEEKAQMLAGMVGTAINCPGTHINTYQNQGDTTVSGSQSSQNTQTFNAPVSNAAGTNYGNMSAIQNIYGPSAADIARLLTALRNQAQTFPTEQKDDANDVLDDLERDLAEEQPDQGRIGRRLKKLVALGAAIGTIASGAAAVSGDVSTFTGNVIELTEKLGIPVEQVQLPSSN